MNTELQILITLDMQTGQVGVTGPIDNKVMAYGMLEAAKDAISEYQRTKGDSRIIAPTPQDFSLPKLS